MITVTDLHVTLRSARGEVEALRGLSFALQRGHTLGLIGESGSGKSLTALALIGLLPDGARAAGSVRFQERELLVQDEAAWCRLRGDRIAMVFQEPMTALNPLHPIARQIAEPLRLHRGLGTAAARAEALRLLDRVRLADARARLDAYPHQLSGGQRQRVGIAIALACAPDVLLADEPTTALDATLQRELLGLLRELVREDGMAMLLISHDLGLMAEHSDELMVMYGGRIVEAGPTAALAARAAHPYTRALQAARPRLGAQAHRAGARLPTIPGSVPALADLPPGCPYADRCAEAVEACRAAVPPAVVVAPGHAAACLRIVR
ncbi:MAG: ABC transporter ATP-binding protein [Burkholderiales bacterium]|nr:ABC transporter ATP-binding protein [Burkholderiales bacterium]